MLAPEYKTPIYTNQVRPAYSVLARMNEGAETVLFGDKFSDWKGALGIISTKPPELGKKNLIVSCYILHLRLFQIINIPL